LDLDLDSLVGRVSRDGRTIVCGVGKTYEMSRTPGIFGLNNVNNDAWSGRKYDTHSFLGLAGQR
jgi:hypothetical protein